MIKVTTIDNPEYQEYETWSDFLKTNQFRHSYNNKPSHIVYRKDATISNEKWHLNGRRHRVGNKPSNIRYYKSGRIRYKEWHLDGKNYSEQDYKQIMEQIEAIPDTEKLLDSRQWIREMVK